jgi:hypothetical protein
MTSARSLSPSRRIAVLAGTAAPLAIAAGLLATQAPASAATASPAKPAAATAKTTDAAAGCWIEFEYAQGNGVNIRTAPSTSATVVAEVNKGKKLTADQCDAEHTVSGSSYEACGAYWNGWIEVKYNGVWRWSAETCWSPF